MILHLSLVVEHIDDLSGSIYTEYIIKIPTVCDLTSQLSEFGPGIFLDKCNLSRDLVLEKKHINELI